MIMEHLFNVEAIKNRYQQLTGQRMLNDRQKAVISARIKQLTDYIGGQMRLKKALRNQNEIRYSQDAINRLREWRAMR